MLGMCRICGLAANWHNFSCEGLSAAHLLHTGRLQEVIMQARNARVLHGLGRRCVHLPARPAYLLRAGAEQRMCHSGEG